MRGPPQLAQGTFGSEFRERREQHIVLQNLVLTLSSPQLTYEMINQSVVIKSALMISVCCTNRFADQVTNTAYSLSGLSRSRYSRRTQSRTSGMAGEEKVIRKRGIEPRATAFRNEVLERR